MNRESVAKKYYEEGYNCCQAVVAAFQDEIGVETDTLLRLSSSFGGGMGGLGEVCGATSGMFMVLGAIAGYDSASAPRTSSSIMRAFVPQQNGLRKNTTVYFAEI